MTDPTAAAREQAQAIIDTVTMKIGTDEAKIKMIAAALIAAEQRGREAGLEEAAKTADGYALEMRDRGQALLKEGFPNQPALDQQAGASGVAAAIRAMLAAAPQPEKP